MSRHLAAILGFCALTTPSIGGGVRPAQNPQLGQDTQAPVAPPSSSPQDSPQKMRRRVHRRKLARNRKPEHSPRRRNRDLPAPPAKAKTTSEKRRHRKTGASTSSAAPDKKVVRNGGTTDPVVQLTPGISKEHASQPTPDTGALLAATDNNLKQISARQLNSSRPGPAA